MENENNIIDAEALMATEEAISLIKSENILKAIKKYHPKDSIQETALAFVNGYLSFIKELALLDLEKNLSRSDFEIKDVVAHANSMLQSKDSYLFGHMVMHCHSHYHAIQKHILVQKTKED